MKKIWIFNHYATNTFFDHAGRHYYFAKYLRQSGYDVTIFCASTVHNSDKNLISDDTLYYVDTCDEIPYVFIKARNYKENGKQRILNMLDYYRGLFRATKALEKPDVIIGSSVHPLACLAALRLSKKYKCRNIVEIRDLWPESLFAFDIMKKETLFGKLLYAGERWLYHKADRLIFTMAGGKDYIVDHGWQDEIPREKIAYINNGIDMELFDYNKEHFMINDADLDNDSLFNIVYTGSIRRVNNLAAVLRVAKEVKNTKVRFLIWGDGDELEILKQHVNAEHISNVIFKGWVDKKYIPYITSKADINYAHNSSSPLFKYGLSFNKIFDYLAAGRPILCDFPANYNPVIMGGAGVAVESADPKDVANQIEEFITMDRKRYDQYCNAARRTAEEYDFKRLTKTLLETINRTRK